jgi:glycosyltransferase involved in cell wall biosynthesis
MRILALEPYFGGSHQAFLEGWVRHSRHDWTLLKHPPRKWKWRMRHAALTMSDMVRERLALGGGWNAVFCSDMLNLAEFCGLAPAAIRELPRMVYFHENQLTYPFRHFGERDFHFGFTNMTTALAADAVWFNSAFHRDDFLNALADVLRRMPDYRSLDAPARIQARSTIQPPGFAPLPPRPPRAPGPLHILWAARWEHDKNPDDFFAALYELDKARVPFRLSVVGEQFDDVPTVFEAARERLTAHIERWGFQRSRLEYVTALQEADVFVSTAEHEFFGISAVEALAAGCRPVLPQRLAYPELVQLDTYPEHGAFFYDGSVKGLVAALRDLANTVEEPACWWPGPIEQGQALAERFAWPTRAAEMDDELEELRGGP